MRLLGLALADVGAGVLAVAGVIKFSGPRPWVEAVRALGVPLGRRGPWVALARLVGLAEIAVAASVVFVGTAAALLTLAVAYAGFVGVALVARRRGGASCGCFGVRSAPITGWHAALDAAVAVGAFVAALDRPESLVARLDGGLGASFAYLVFAVLGVVMTITAMTTAADLFDVRRRVTPRTAPVRSDPVRHRSPTRAVGR